MAEPFRAEVRAHERSAREHELLATPRRKGSCNAVIRPPLSPLTNRTAPQQHHENGDVSSVDLFQPTTRTLPESHATREATTDASNPRSIAQRRRRQREREQREQAQRETRASVLGDMRQHSARVALAHRGMPIASPRLGKLSYIYGVYMRL